jgi:hypothetical protein
MAIFKCSCITPFTSTKERAWVHKFYAKLHYLACDTSITAMDKATEQQRYLPTDKEA